MATASDASVVSMYEISRAQFNAQKLAERIEWVDTISIDQRYVPVIKRAFQLLHDSDQCYGTAPVGVQHTQDPDGTDLIEFIDRYDTIAFAQTARVRVIPMPADYKINERPFARLLITPLSAKGKLKRLGSPRLTAEDLMTVIIDRVDALVLDPDYRWSPLLYLPLQIAFTLVCSDIATAHEICIVDGELKIGLSNRSDGIVISIDLLALKNNHEAFIKRWKESDK